MRKNKKKQADRHSVCDVMRYKYAFMISRHSSRSQTSHGGSLGEVTRWWSSTKVWVYNAPEWLRREYSSLQADSWPKSVGVVNVKMSMST